MFDLSNRVSLVTGASRGIGKGIALALAKSGAHVVINYLNNKGEAEEVVDQIKSLGRRALAVQGDVSQEGDVAHLFELTMREFSRLDILVNNAGTTAAEDIFSIDYDSWMKILNTNLTSNFLCAKYAMEIMKEARFGRIIQISSIVGHRGALYGHVHYAATKSGQLGLTKTLARTGAPYGITVNAVAPGIIGTELLYQTHSAEELEEIKRAIPLGEIGRVEDVGAAVVFLASEEARFITGATIDVNGGMYMR